MKVKNKDKDVSKSHYKLFKQMREEVAFDVNDPNDHLMEEYIEKEKKNLPYSIMVARNRGV